MRQGNRTVLRLQTLALMPVLLILTSCGSGPHLEIPAPGPENYTSLEPVAIHAVSPHEVWVTGSLTRNDGTPEGLILATETGGRTWRRLGVEVHDLGRMTFQTIYFSDRLRGWVAGLRVDALGRTRAVLFRTDDGGSHWREVTLIQDVDVVITQIHSLLFRSDLEGVVTLSVLDAAGKPKDTTYITRDGGRSWTVAAYLKPQQVPFRDQSIVMLDSTRGFRLRRSQYPGVHLVEATASEGKDWMPIAELSLAALNTYY